MYLYFSLKNAALHVYTKFLKPKKFNVFKTFLIADNAARFAKILKF